MLTQDSAHSQTTALKCVKSEKGEMQALVAPFGVPSSGHETLDTQETIMLTEYLQKRIYFILCVSSAFPVNHIQACLMPLKARREFQSL